MADFYKQPHKSVKDKVINSSDEHCRQIIGYIRVSTADQAGGVETQKKFILDKIKEVEERNPNITYSIVEFIVDESVPGDTDIDSRKGFSQLLSLIQLYKGSGKPIKEVWVQNRDRIARDVDLLGYASYTLRKYGCYIQDCSQDISPLEQENNREKLITRIFDAMSEQELIKYREKARLGRERRVHSGKAITRPPLGYKIDTSTNSIIIDEEKESIIRGIYEAYYKQNALPSQIASHYNMSKSTVYYILKNKIYSTGEIRYGKFTQKTEPICPEYNEYH